VDEGETEDLREQTLPLPAQPGRPGPSSRGPVPWWIVLLVAVAGVTFIGGYLLGRAQAPDPAVRRPPLQVQDAGDLAEFCSEALDRAARLSDVQRRAIENRTAFAAAVVEGSFRELPILDLELEELRVQADRLRTSFTRALVRCPA
jgi:hypothetical protein